MVLEKEQRRRSKGINLSLWQTTWTEEQDVGLL